MIEDNISVVCDRYMSRYATAFIPIIRNINWSSSLNFSLVSLQFSSSVSIMPNLSLSSSIILFSSLVVLLFLWCQIRVFCCC